MRRPTLYKQRGTWYARFWNENEKKYHSKSLGVPVEGKKERRREAQEAALKMAVDMAAKGAGPNIQTALTSVPLLEYAESFWKPDSEYAREKALLEKNRYPPIIF